MKMLKLALVLMIIIIPHEVDARLTNNKDGWNKISPNVAFQRNTEVSLKNPFMNAATDEAINRMLEKSSGTNPSYNYQSIDSSANYDEYQLAWRFLGFYIDCSTTNSYGAGCNRQVLYAVYVDPNYEGGGIGEYMYYDKSSDEFKCYEGGSCRAKMDCHERDTEWKMLGVFKIENIVGNYGFMGQLFKHEGYCLWGQDSYNTASTMRQALPYYCKETNLQLSNGSYLYYAIKPVTNGEIGLGLYTDEMCSTEYTGDDINAYDLEPSYQTYWESFNEDLSVFKQCQPCVTYDLSASDFSCTDIAGYTNANMCMKFFKKAGCKAASTDDIVLASRQRGLVSFEIDGVTYGDSSSFYDENATLGFYNVSEATKSISSIASIALPFDLPELPEFFTSWTFFAVSALCFILGLITCCCCKTSVSDEKKVSLLDESLSKESPLVRTLSKVRNSSINSLSSAVTSLKGRVKIGSDVDSTKQDRESIELCRVSNSTKTPSFDASSISRSRKSAACQTSFDIHSNKSQSSALNRILKTLSNGVIAATQGENEHGATHKDKEEALEEGAAEGKSDSFSSSKSKISKQSSRSSRNDKSVSLAPIDEKTPVTEALTTVSKSSSNSKSKKSSISKRISSKFQKMMFGGGKAGKGTDDAIQTVAEDEPHHIKTLVLAGSQGTDVILQNSGVALGEAAHNNSRQVMNEEENGVVHEICMAVGEGVHLCVSPKMLLEDQGDQVNLMSEANIPETIDCQLAHEANTNSKSDGISGESDTGMVHSSLMSLGQGIHNILPYHDARDTGIGHDTCMAVGVGVQNVGEGFYSMMNKK